MNNYLLSGLILGIILSEALYLLFCHDSSKRTIKNDWLGVKMLCMFFGFLLSSAIITLIYVIITNISLIISNIRILGIGIVILIGVIIFFYINKYLGLKIARKR